MIARYLPRSLNLLTNEIARRQEGKAARRDGGAGRGVKLSLFLRRSSRIRKHQPRSPTVRLTAGLPPALGGAGRRRSREETDAALKLPPHAGQCDKCRHPLTRIDFYGELLESCIYCNV